MDIREKDKERSCDQTKTRSSSEVESCLLQEEGDIMVSD